MNKKLVSLSILPVAILGLALIATASTAHAEMGISGKTEIKADLYRSGGKNYNDDNKGWDDKNYNQGIVGTVTATNTNSLSVKNNRDGKIYTVTTKDATLSHGSTALVLADIKVGDLVIIKGTMTGELAFSATEIKNPNFSDKFPENEKGENLKPGIMGTVTAINDTTLTVTDKNGKVYTVTTVNAKFQKEQGASITINDIDTGDTVMIQGTIDGDKVTATNVFDVQLSTGAWNNTKMKTNVNARQGFFYDFGNFFKRLFGGRNN